MSISCSRLLSLLALTCCAASPLALAQTKIVLNTANGGACVAVTNSDGLTLVPGSTDLKAEGVQLTAVAPGACNPAGGGSSSEFGVSVQTSGTFKVGQPFTVTWAASADATTCAFGGSSSMEGWILGSRACGGTTGLSCAGSHPVSVTPAAPGDYTFDVTCTNDSGYKATPINVPIPTTPAPTPNPISLTVPPTATAGVPFAVTWPTMSNAASCKGSGKLDGVDAPNLGDWTSRPQVETSRNVTVPTGSTGELKLTLTCWNSDNSASAAGTSTAIAVSVGSADACPATINSPNPNQANRVLTLLRTSNISYVLGTAVRPNVNLLEWDNVWGHATTTDSTTPWPGPVGALPVIKQFTRGSYMGVHFKTPASGGVAGTFTHANYIGDPNIVMAISKTCGDFTQNLPNPPNLGCRVDHAMGSADWTGVPSSDSAMVRYKFTANAPASYCNLEPNTDYYVNMYFADPAQVTDRCSQGAATCPLGSQRR